MYIKELKHMSFFKQLFKQSTSSIISWIIKIKKTEKTATAKEYKGEFPLLIKPGLYLPCCKARGAHQMPTGLNLDIFVVLSTNFTKLESGAHFTI